MAVHSMRNAFKRASPQVSKAGTFPAPVLGVDSRSSLTEANQKHCIYTFNMIPSAYGMRVRRGYQEWCTNLEHAGGVSRGVSTIIPFGGDDTDGSNDRLFAVTNEGMWNVTEQDNPISEFRFLDVGMGGDVTEKAGHGVYTQVTTDAETHLLYYADSANGLFMYDADLGAWARVVGLTGVDDTKVSFITVHKDQIWMFERESSIGWYLPSGAITGAATAFYFGTKFSHGGDLAGMYNWTVDGGEGIDDYFVAVSRAGDVLAYKGTNPSDAEGSWGLHAQYFIGAVPKNSKFGSEHGGNLQLLSAYGLISMDDLIQGVDGKDINAKNDTAKIAPIVRREMNKYRLDSGWSVQLIPSQGLLIVTQPKDEDNQFIQFIMSTDLESWGFWRDVPILAIDEWKADAYFGDDQNRVLKMDTNLDDITLAPPPEGELNGKAIRFSLLTSFQNLEAPALFKRGKYIRAQFVSLVVPSQTSEFRYDYDLSEVTNIDASIAVTSGFWDDDDWDAGYWAIANLSGVNQVRGAWGMGRNVAVGMAGESTTETTLVGWDIVWDVGAPI